MAMAQGLSAPAQDAKQEEAPQKLEKIEVQGTDDVEERRESTAAKIVINREEILRHGDTSLLDVMKRLPGVTLGGAGGRGSAIRMRGLGSGYTQILLNGEPMPPGFSLESIAPDLIERIEIVRGAMAQFSTQAIAGTINVVLRRAISQRQRELKLGVNMRNKRAGVNASGQVSDRIDNLSYTIPVAVYGFRFESEGSTEQLGTDAAGTVTSSYVTRQPGQGRGGGINLSPRLNWRFAKDHTLANETFVNYNRFRGESGERSTTLAGTGPVHAASDVDTSSAASSARTNFTWIRALGRDGKVEVKLGLNRNTRSSESTLDAVDASGAPSLHRVSEQRASDNGVTTNGKYQLAFIPGHSLALGWDAARATRAEDRLQTETARAGLRAFNFDESSEARVGRLAFFAQDEWDVSSRFSAYLGLRWEGIDTRSLGNTFDDVRNRSSVLSPIVHGLWKLAGKDQVRASLARTYKAPSTFDLIPRRFIAINNTATTPDSQGNPGLKPELSWGLDAAFEHYFEGGGVFSISAFQRRVEDVIRREVHLDESGRYVSRPVNGGRATIRGIELDAKVNLRTLVAGAPSADLRANLSRNWSSVDSVPGPDNRLDQQTKLSGTVGGDYRFTSVPMTAGGSFSFKSGGPVRLSAAQTVYTSAVRTLDLYALWKFTPTTQLRVTASNLLAQDFVRIDRFVDSSGSLRLASNTAGYRGVGAMLEVKL